MRDLLDYRPEFPILEHTTYLINHSLAAMPRRAEDRLREYARMWAERGIRSWGEGWWTTPMTVGDQVGRIVGAPAGTTVMHQNVAVAEAVPLVLPAVRPRRNRVVYEVTSRRCATYQAQPDLEVVVRGRPAIVDAIDERTLPVPISHVLSRPASRTSIVRRAHEVGARDPDCTSRRDHPSGRLPGSGSAEAPGTAGLRALRPAERLEPTFIGWQAHDAVRVRGGDALRVRRRPVSRERPTCLRTSRRRRATT
jgi:hypothetical protein